MIASVCVWCANENPELNKIGWVILVIKNHLILIEWAYFAFIDRMRIIKKAFILSHLDLLISLRFQIKCTIVIVAFFCYCCEMCSRKRCNKIRKMCAWYLIFMFCFDTNFLVPPSNANFVFAGLLSRSVLCFFFESLWMLAQPSHKK